MILITGGAYQGKSNFADELAEKKGFELSDTMQKPNVICNIHLLVKQFLQEEKDPYMEMEKLVQENPQVIFTVNELGCGVVPVDPFDRKWRETTGRICCVLAKKAEAVYRVTCGVATQIK